MEEEAKYTVKYRDKGKWTPAKKVARKDYEALGDSLGTVRITLVQ